MDDLVLDDWQKEVLEHRGDLILCTGRQIGKTFIMSRKAVKRMLEKPNQQIIIVSLTEDQAKLIINMILVYLEKHFRSKIAKGKNKPTQNKVTLVNGSYALARPVGNSGDAIRGFTGTVLIIDEASRFPELAFTSGEPTLLSTGGEVWMCSTPHGKSGYFWEQYNATTKQDDTDKENDMGWRVIHVNGEEAILNRKISRTWSKEQKEKSILRLKRLRERWSDLRYGQEILAKFLDDLQRFYSEELIEKGCIMKRPQFIPQDVPTYMGNDLARLGGDSFTAEIFINEGDTTIQVENFYKNKLLTTENEALILEFANQYNCRKVGIDAGAGTLGVSILDHLLNTRIRHKVVAMNNRQIALDSDGKKKQRLNMEEFHDNLRRGLELGTIKLLDDESIKNSLRSVMIEFVKDNNDMVTHIRLFGSDMHIAEGIVRGVYLAQKEKGLKLWAY